jgi:hypothetical protein
MRSKLLIIVSLLMLSTAGPIHGQITSNPIPEPIMKRGLAVEVRDVVRLPRRGAAPHRPRRVAFRLGAAELCAIS